MRSICSRILFLWVTIITVLPTCRNSVKAFCSAVLPASSKFEFGSSKITTFGSPYKARAKATRCRCPADNVKCPSSLDSYPFGSASIISCTPALRAALTTASESMKPNRAMFSAMVPSKSSISCGR